MAGLLPREGWICRTASDVALSVAGFSGDSHEHMADANFPFTGAMFAEKNER